MSPCFVYERQHTLVYEDNAHIYTKTTHTDRTDKQRLPQRRCALTVQANSVCVSMQSVCVSMQHPVRRETGSLPWDVALSGWFQKITKPEFWRTTD